MKNKTQHPVSVLVVEDDPLFLDLITDLLESEDRFICQAAVEKGVDALSVVEGDSPLDVVLLDIGLPDTNGISLIRQIKEMRPEVSVVMLTVFDDSDKVVKALEEGASGYLLKAESEDRILQALLDAGQGGGVFTPSIAAIVLNLFQKNKPVKHSLTPTELEVLNLLKQGLTKQKIADQTHRAYYTIDTHLKNVYQKLHVNSGIQAVIKAMEKGMI